MQVLLENPGCSSSTAEYRTKLDNQLRDDVIRGGFPSWNVSLSRSINAMPAQAHYDPVTAERKEITGFMRLADSNVIMSTTTCGSVSLWATKAGLVNLGSFNFKLQAYAEHKGELSRAKLLFENLPSQETTDGVRLYKNTAVKGVKGEDRDEAPKEEPAHDEGEGGVLQALFDQTEFDASIEAAEAEGADDTAGVSLWNLQKEFDTAPAGRDKPLPASFLAKLQASLEGMKADAKAEKDPKVPKAPAKVEKAPKAKKAATAKEKEKPKDADTNKEYMKVLMDMGFNEKLSKAALAKVENQGVTEAVEVAIKLQGEPEYQEAPPKKVAPDAKVALKAWSCPREPARSERMRRLRG
jgi:hypothetical protein